MMTTIRRRAGEPVVNSPADEIRAFLRENAGTIYLNFGQVNDTNCLIKKVLEMGIVASNIKVLEINETYRHWQQPVGGKDEAHDATAAGGGVQNSSSVSTQPEERKEQDLERASRADGIQSRLCQTSAAPTRSTTEAREAI